MVSDVFFDDNIAFSCIDSDHCSLVRQNTETRIKPTKIFEKRSALRGQLGHVPGVHDRADAEPADEIVFVKSKSLTSRCLSLDKSASIQLSVIFNKQMVKYIYVSLFLNVRMHLAVESINVKKYAAGKI